MILPIAALIFGIVLLVWSADRFIEGSAAAARRFGMPSLLIGMIIVGFGTSAPEMVVSATASWQGNSGIALGNAYGSNICNIALILGISALINPIIVHSRVIRKELPILTAVTILAVFQLWDRHISSAEAWVLLIVFAGLVAWSIWQGIRKQPDALTGEMEEELKIHKMPLGKAVFWIVVGLILLIISSKILVWAAVSIAHSMGVSDLVIGLTVVAVGTSLPELASSIIAARKNEHDIALGNILGSNLFNTLAVVGLGGVINPLTADPMMFARDLPVMTILTVSLFIICFGTVEKPGRINRYEGAVLLAGYAAYTGWLIFTAYKTAS